MASRYQQSEPPSPHHVRLAMLVGPGGTLPFIYRDRDIPPSRQQLEHRSLRLVLVSLLRRTQTLLLRLLRAAAQQPLVRHPLSAFTKASRKCRYQTTAECCP